MNRIAIFEGNDVSFAGPKRRRKSRKSKARSKSSKYTRGQVRSAFGKAAVKCRAEAPGKGKYGTCMRREMKKNLGR